MLVMEKYVIWFDFGTTNSTIWAASESGDMQLIPLWDEKIETRTALYYDGNNNSFSAWDEAIQDFKDNPKWRLFQSPKSWLNSRIELETQIRPGKTINITQIVEEIASKFKSRVENVLNADVDSVVVWRPVKFHDTDKYLDKLAQNRLEKALKKSWFKNIEFEFEPNAALKNYLNTNPNEGNALVVDIWGWTSDFSIVNVDKGWDSEILSNGWIYIWWNKLDLTLSNLYFASFLWRWTTYRSYKKDIDVPSIYYWIIADWKNLHTISMHKNLNAIRWHYTFSNDQEKYWRLLEIAEDNMKWYKYIDMVESAKKNLSFSDGIVWTADFFNTPFVYDLSRDKFNSVIRWEIELIKKTILETIKGSQLKPNEINTIFFTWWTWMIPYVQKEIFDLLGAKSEIIKWDALNSVWYWLTQIAKERFF